MLSPRVGDTCPYGKSKADILNTASWARMQSGLAFSSYAASKFAVVNMSERLAIELKPLGIGVTVLCRSFVRTRISESVLTRIDRLANARPTIRPVRRRVDKYPNVVEARGVGCPWDKVCVTPC
jgi:NAD(P)-dependent dehydrogenase (short-subunit alcohol dehydrogenase family)